MITRWWKLMSASLSWDQTDLRVMIQSIEYMTFYHNGWWPIISIALFPIPISLDESYLVEGKYDKKGKVTFPLFIQKLLMFYFPWYLNHALLRGIVTVGEVLKSPSLCCASLLQCLSSHNVSLRFSTFFYLGSPNFAFVFYMRSFSLYRFRYI